MPSNTQIMIANQANNLVTGIQLARLAWTKKGMATYIPMTEFLKQQQLQDTETAGDVVYGSTRARR